MRQFDVSSALGGLPQMPRVPAAVAPSWGATGGYTPLGNDVAREVRRFIAEGAPASTDTLSPEAHWRALQAARQAGAVGDTALPAAEPAVAEPQALRPEQQAFLARITPWAQQAADRLGVSVRSVLAHAALESGWGQKPLRSADGSDSLNLFGIKATGAGSGASVQALTTEFEDGVAQLQTQAFRRYASLQESFDDYARLLSGSARYRGALGTGGDVQAFASALAAGGYATDPQYAHKLVRVSRAIAAQPGS